MEILAMGFEMTGERIDFLGQECNLHDRRPGIFAMGLEIADNFRFLFFKQCQFFSPCLPAGRLTLFPLMNRFYYTISLPDSQAERKVSPQEGVSQRQGHQPKWPFYDNPMSYTYLRGSDNVGYDRALCR